MSEAKRMFLISLRSQNEISLIFNCSLSLARKNMSNWIGWKGVNVSQIF